MKTALKVKLISLALLAHSSQVSAADWLMLQDSQPEFVAPTRSISFSLAT